MGLPAGVGRGLRHVLPSLPEDQETLVLGDGLESADGAPKLAPEVARKHVVRAVSFVLRRPGKPLGIRGEGEELGNRLVRFALDDLLRGARGGEHHVVVLEPGMRDPAVRPVPDPGNRLHPRRYARDIVLVYEHEQVVQVLRQPVPFVPLALDVAYAPAESFQGVAHFVGGVPITIAVVHIVAGQRDRHMRPLLGPEGARPQPL